MSTFCTCTSLFAFSRTTGQTGQVDGDTAVTN